MEFGLWTFGVWDIKVFLTRPEGFGNFVGISRRHLPSVYSRFTGYMKFKRFCMRLGHSTNRS